MEDFVKYILLPFIFKFSDNSNNMLSNAYKKLGKAKLFNKLVETIDVKFVTKELIIKESTKTDNKFVVNNFINLIELTYDKHIVDNFLFNNFINKIPIHDKLENEDVEKVMIRLNPFMFKDKLINLENEFFNLFLNKLMVDLSPEFLDYLESYYNFNNNLCKSLNTYLKPNKEVLKNMALIFDVDVNTIKTNIKGELLAKKDIIVIKDKELSKLEIVWTKI